MYNREFNIIDSELKAYTLGLWFADGCIIDSGSIQITLKDDDDIIDKIANEFPFFNINTNGNALVLRKQDTLLAEDFKLHGALPRKSYENRELLNVPKIKEELIHHFIRGFFDGDGSVFIQKVNNIKLEIGCAGFNFISQILKILYDNGIFLYMRCDPPLEINVRKQNYYIIYSSSYVISKKFAEFIYKDATIFMNRKRILLEKELISRNAKERLSCQHCSSINTTYVGFRNKKVRIYCKDCDTRSSQTAPNYSNIISGEDELLES
jgi:intein/homing endonuclease